MFRKSKRIKQLEKDLASLRRRFSYLECEEHKWIYNGSGSDFHCNKIYFFKCDACGKEKREYEKYLSKGAKQMLICMGILEIEKPEKKGKKSAS